MPASTLRLAAHAHWKLSWALLVVGLDDWLLSRRHVYGGSVSPLTLLSAMRSPARPNSIDHEMVHALTGEIGK